jgi:predicted CXXCH cytochrome family protein
MKKEAAITMKRRFLGISEVLTGALTFAIAVFAAAFLFLPLSHAANETHLDKTKLPRGCSSCHKGHGARATAMLGLHKDELCFKCHGPVKDGAPGQAKTDIYSVILKKSNHRVLQTSKYHVAGEILPERSPSTPRHVSCYDCHSVHFSTRGQTFKGVRGYSGTGGKLKRAEKEYEVCYLCHSESTNLPHDASNIAREFDPGNKSFHPVQAVGKNRGVPSLRRSAFLNRTMDCSDCHGNDDRYGPKGPHGSNYARLLKANYTMESGPESPFAYALCYECHNRNSILNDESFQAHKRHVLYGNISCFACHDAHGSRDRDNLINFDTRVSFPNSHGRFAYMKVAPGKPRCFLKCHVRGLTYDHRIKDAQYCVNNNCPPEW